MKLPFNFQQVPYASLLRSAIFATSLIVGTVVHVSAQSFATPDPSFKGQVFVSTPLVLPGSDVDVSGRGFKPGQKITLFSGTTSLNSTPYTADAEGGFKGTIKVPASATPGQYPLIANVTNPAAATVFNLKVSPNIPKSGADRFDVKTAVLVPGLYQVAYSAKHDVLYVTSSIGRPPVKEAHLLKVNPKTLAIEAKVTPAKVPGHNDDRVFAVYGVAVDDAKDTVWVTNTRDATVSVYKQSDLSLVKQFDSGLVAHSRDVVVDSKRGKAYVSASGAPVIAVFDTNKLEFIKNIDLKSNQRFQKFTPGSLELDSKSGKLFTPSMQNPEAAIINIENDSVEKVIDLPAGVRSAIGIAYDGTTGKLFVVSQGSDNLVIVDTETGKVLKDVLVGGSPLNVAYEPVGKLVYITNRTSGTLTVVDGNGKIVANLEAGHNVNHLHEDGKGNVFVVNKSSWVTKSAGDEILRVTPKK